MRGASKRLLLFRTFGSDRYKALTWFKLFTICTTDANIYFGNYLITITYIGIFILYRVPFNAYWEITNKNWKTQHFRINRDNVRSSLLFTENVSI